MNDPECATGTGWLQKENFLCVSLQIVIQLEWFFILVKCIIGINNLFILFA